MMLATSNFPKTPVPSHVTLQNRGRVVLYRWWGAGFVMGASRRNRWGQASIIIGGLSMVIFRLTYESVLAQDNIREGGEITASLTATAVTVVFISSIIGSYMVSWASSVE